MNELIFRTSHKSNTQHSFRTAEAQSLFGQLSDFEIDAGQIGFVCVIGNKTLLAILTRVRDKISIQTVLTALIFRHKQVEPQVYCQKSNRQ